MNKIRMWILAVAVSLSVFVSGSAPSWAALEVEDEYDSDFFGYQLPDKYLEVFSLNSLDVSDSHLNEIETYGYYPGGMNAAEANFCANPVNWSKCYSAKAAADDALSRTQQKFPGFSLYQDIADAYRHCYWSARMTIDMGVSDAKGFGDRHESESYGADKQMDLSNNATGRGVGQKYTTHSKASNRCEWLARNNRLVALR